MLSQIQFETIDDEIKNEWKEKLYKKELDSKNELKLKIETLSKIQNILQTPKGSKSIEDLKFLYNYFMKFKFFNSGIDLYGKNTIINLLDICNLINVASNDIIINLGDNVKSAYILISGNIKISSLKQKINANDKERARFKTSDKMNKVLNLFLLKALKNVDQDVQHDLRQTIEMLQKNNIRFSKPKPKRALNIEDDWYVNIGDMFGDKYLIERKVSSLSFFTTKKSYLLEIKKKDFYNFIEQIRKEEFLCELKFFHSISIFSSFSRNAIERMKLNMKEKTYLNGEIVIEQNQLIDNVFIVKSGGFQISYRSTKNIFNEFDLNYYTNITPIDFRFTENLKHEIKGYKKTESNLKLLTVEKGQFIGDLEFIQKRKNSFFTVTCIHEGSVLISMPSIIFDKHISDQKDEFFDFTKDRENYYKERFKKLSTISKAICYNNPETKYIKDLIVRIENGMEYIKINEKNHNRASSHKIEIKDDKIKTFDLDYKKQKIIEDYNNNDAKMINKEIFLLKNKQEDFLKDYNRTGDYNERFKKIKRKIKKKIFSKINSYKKSSDQNQRHKSSVPLREKSINLDNEVKELDEKEADKDNKSSNVFFKSTQKLNRLNSANINYNIFEKLSCPKIDVQVKSIAPKKVEELYSTLKKISNIYNDKIKKKFESQNIPNTFFSSLIKEKKPEPTNRDIESLKENSYASKSQMKINNQSIDKANINNSYSQYKIIAESDSKTNIRMANLSKDKKSYNMHELKKKDNSFIPHKIKIKKISLEDWKKECKNLLNFSIDLSMNNHKKKNSLKKIEFNKIPLNNNEELDFNKDRPLTSFISSTKINKINSVEKSITNENLLSIENKSEIILINSINLKSEKENDKIINGNDNHIENDLKSQKIKKQEPSPKKTKIILNTVNREIGEFNNELYIIDENKKIDKDVNNYDEYSRNRIPKNANDKSCSTTNLYNIVNHNDENQEKIIDDIHINNHVAMNDQIEISENIDSKNNNIKPQESKINKKLNSLKSRKKEESIKKGISCEIGYSKNLNTQEIKEIWDKRKTEIFRNIENKRNGNNPNDKLDFFIKSTKIKPILAKKTKSNSKRKQLYNLDKRENFTKSKYETSDVKMNINVIVKDKNIFDLKRKKELLKTTEFSKGIYVDSGKITNILNTKYDYFKKHSVEKSIEKSINLRKNIK